MNEALINQGKELIEKSDEELMGLSLSKNEKWSENYLMVINIKLRKTIISLNKEVSKLRKSTNISSLIMGIMTFFILCLTIVLVWKQLSPEI